MAGPFPLLADEHIPSDLIRALRARGYVVRRVEDEPGLGKGAVDARVFAHAAANGLVWLTRDARALVHPKLWHGQGKSFRGVICWLQRHRLGVGEVLRQIDAFAAEDDPFASGVRHIKAGE